MPSEEFIAVVTEFEAARDRKGRFDALDKMWLLEDPEIIEILMVIYTENDDKKTRDKAGEVLGKYKGLYNAMRAPQKASGGGRAGLRNILVITLLLLVGANAALLFMGATSSEDNEPERDLVAERAGLLQQMETDITAMQQVAIVLRSTARDIEENTTTVEAACALAFDAIPEPITLAEDQKGFFPDISSYVTDPLGNYLYSLDAATLALETWNTGCGVQNVVTDTVIDLATAADNGADIALNQDIPNLRDNPFVTPTPTPRPTNTPTNTPEPTATLPPRDQNELIAQLYEQVELADFNSERVVILIDQILADSNMSEFCRSGSIWGTDTVRQITLTGDEVVSFPEVDAYLADPNNPLSTLITENLAIIAERNALCPSNNDSVRLATLRRRAETMGTTIRGVETSLLNTVGPNPN